MAEVTLRLRYNPKTGKRELVIHLESEADALPHEHERDHRALAEALLGQKLGDDVGAVHVERVAPATKVDGEAAPDEAAAADEPAARERDPAAR